MELVGAHPTHGDLQATNRAASAFNGFLFSKGYHSNSILTTIWALSQVEQVSSYPYAQVRFIHVLEARLIVCPPRRPT